jgi:hypothetical protein
MPEPLDHEYLRLALKNFELSLTLRFGVMLFFAFGALLVFLKLIKA